MNLVDLVYWIAAILGLFLLLSDWLNNFDFLQSYFLVFTFLSIVLNLYFIHRIYKINGAAFSLLRFLKIDLNWERYSRFFKYGGHRLPQGFMIAGIFFIPIFVASKSFSLSVAAYVGIIISIINVMQILVYPFNLIFVPKFSHYQATKQEGEITKYSQLVLEFCLTLPFLAGIYVFFLTRELILMWFGQNYEVVVNYFFYVGPTIGFYLSFILIRGILDGLYDKPYVNYITLIAFAVTLILGMSSAFFRWELAGLTVSIITGLMALGMTAIIILVKKQKLKFFNIKNILAIIWLIGLGFLLTYLNRWFPQYEIISALLIKSLILLIFFFISIVFYKILGFFWIDELWLRFKELKHTVES
jgi:O-antigen/teichoic acid export membrane protein